MMFLLLHPAQSFMTWTISGILVVTTGEHRMFPHKESKLYTATVQQRSLDTNLVCSSLGDVSNPTLRVIP